MNASADKRLMEVTRYFAEQVMRKRPYLTPELCEMVVTNPIRRDVQSDGRIRLWGRISLPGEHKSRILRVILLEDDATIHNAFLDRDYREDDR